MATYKKLSTIGVTSENKSSINEKHTETFTIPPLPEIKSIEDKNAFITKNKVCVIDIYAEWCGPCKIVKPLFEKLQPIYNAENVCCLVKENIELGFSPDVRVVPTFQFFLNGKLDSIITGADIDSIEKKINELILI